MICYHCGEERKYHRRHLCYRCYWLPGVRYLYAPIQRKGVGIVREETVKPAEQPTRCPPGSLGKLIALARRARRGQELFSEMDKRADLT